MLMLYGRVFPGVEMELKSVFSTRPHTRACDWLCGISQYTP
ncbi:23S rRNA [Gossypium arboreum]|uniref:23S rRNA n=1 Tax=Gossypium arboreum TaxID=29729 RepID=A0A0B0MS18_GOSAR|nr:23S rRNA [Gossypium arboreum]